jgi:DNA polymerase-3 subunit delta
LRPDQFLQTIRKQPPAPAYLFLGPEAYQRRLCREALIERALPADDRADGLARVDLDETTLSSVLDDARSLSLFAANRVIWASGAEAALPRRIVEKDDGAADDGLSGYLRDPTPGTVVVFECSRYEFEGEDKQKLERVQKFFAAIPDVVEFRPFPLADARRLAQDLARDAGLRIGLAEIGLLVEALASDAGRIANEIEKLSLYAGKERKISADDIARLVPNAQDSTIFELVEFLGRRDRRRSLDSLDRLIREGEYLPLALTFLATQFRLALAAQEAGLRNSQQIQNYFTKQGIRIWRQRADQVQQTVSAFTRERLAQAIEQVHCADKALRDTRPDDRVVMEELVLSLTASGA